MLIISDKVWNEIKKVIPVKETKIGRPENDPRIVLSGIFYIMVTGAQWSKLPRYYGPSSTVHGRFMIWARSGIFEQILRISIDAAIEQLGFPESFLYDTSSAKSPFAKFGGKNPTDRAKNGVKKGVVSKK